MHAFRLLPLFAVAAAAEWTEEAVGHDPSHDRYGLAGVNPLNLELIKVTSEAEEPASVAAIQKLLGDGASPSSHGDYNYSALMWSIVKRRPEHVQLLLEAGADTEFTNAWGRNAIFLAAWEGQAEVMALLVKHGADVDAAAKHDGYSALHKASELGHVEVVRTLLDAGAEVNLPTLPERGERSAKVGMTPLDLATQNGHEAVREMLIARHAVPASELPPEGKEEL